jgi:very-short-patch-repair endonuclease
MDTSEKLQEIRRPLLRHLSLVELRQAETRLAQIRQMLEGTSGPISIKLQEFFQVQVGNRSVDDARVLLRSAELLAELRRIWALKADMDFVVWAGAAIRKAGAHNLARRVLHEAAPSAGDDNIFPANWQDAWKWARLKTHLEGIDAKDELKALVHQRRESEVLLAKLYREMVAEAAWLATKQTATPKILSALNGYATAVHRIGRGTGPNAIRYRRDARNAMQQAQAAVPCWIMDHGRVSESMPAEIGSFDLIIVDEASQSDLWALPAILRGKRILVVGDDKQVSPDSSFLRSDHIEDLRKRFLTDQWFKEEMTPEKSLYDLAARVFAASQVMLREHFRCVEAIIEYSNHNFYRGQIKPLRIARPSERLDPPLIDIYVGGGVRDRRDCNEDEARAIADEIEAILVDPKFAGRTLGVVTLLGTDQAKHIDQVVREKCDPAELYRRKFLSGDPTSFQGSERSIIFLSMVVDPSQCTALSGNKHDQRFNVAASRAQDRMYLVRSVTSADLSDKDVRKGLLAHFDKPMATDKEEIANLIDKCESGFEKEVFLFLCSERYRVIPQVKAGSYRIDMVVEGANDARLAIECDGDAVHGPDRWQQDMHRQRILERAGWQFWRCFHSTWILHKDEMKAELLAHLSAVKIEPLGALTQSNSLVEKRVWKPSVQDLPLWSKTDMIENLAATTSAD